MHDLTRRLEPRDERPATLWLSLDHEQRRRSRLRVTLSDGSEASVRLARGTPLHHGDRLCGEGAGPVVEIRAAPEPVSIASTEDPLLLLRAAYHLGNRHVRLQIEPGHVLYGHDHVLDDLCRELGLSVESDRRPFQPEAGGYGHGHGHDHDHDHHHHHHRHG